MCLPRTAPVVPIYPFGMFSPALTTQPPQLRSNMTSSHKTLPSSVTLELEAPDSYPGSATYKKP